MARLIAMEGTAEDGVVEVVVVVVVVDVVVVKILRTMLATLDTDIFLFFPF